MKLPAKIEATEIAPIRELEGWATLAVKAQIIPAQMNVFQAMAIVQAGKEMGLQPLQSLRSMSFIRGRLTMSVQLQLAMAKNRGVTMEDPDEGEGYCEVTLHRGKETVTCRYTLEDAQKAGLISAGGSWTKYERQMLRWRAIGDALRLIAPDMVMNLLSPEEAQSIEPLEPLAVEALPEQAPAPAPPPGAATEEGADEQDAPPPPPKEDEKELQDYLWKLCNKLGKMQGCGGAAILHDITMNKEGKFGKIKASELALSMFKKDGKEWSPLKAAISKAEKELEKITADEEALG